MPLLPLLPSPRFCESIALAKLITPMNLQFPNQNKLMQVYRYLEALNQLRNPVVTDIQEQPWRLWLRDLPNHSSVRVAQNSHNAMTFILKVRRPKLTPAPPPPEEIIHWLSTGWRDAGEQVGVKRVMSQSDAQEVERIVRFDDDPLRPRLLGEWKARREKWAEAERPAFAAMNLYERLYSLKSQLDRESESVEMVLGDGLLNWPLAQRIHHPILLQRARLEFDPSVPEFSIVQADYPPELYTALLLTAPQAFPAAVGQLRDRIEQHGYHPLGQEETSIFLREMVGQLSTRGEFVGVRDPAGTDQAPQIGRAPVIFLRRRTLGFSTALRSILEDLPTRADLPISINRIVGIDPAAKPSSLRSENREARASQHLPDEDEDVLLTKEANEEQLQIAKRLDNHGAVLVQGPPGTGKTHTIANLLGHLLAQGKNVLVTSHTDKALKVLREKVVEPLQPLCVSVLKDDRLQMGKAVDAILDQLSTLDPAQLEREAANLADRRKKLIASLRDSRRKLLLARQDEYRAVVWGGKEYSPSNAARLVNTGRAANNWIPAPVILGEPLPLSEGEVIELYRTNGSVTPADEEDLGHLLPDPQTFISPTEFERMIDERNRLLNLDLDYASDLWSTVAAEQKPEELERLSVEISRADDVLGEEHGWLLYVIEAGREGGVQIAAWESLLTEIAQAYDMAVQGQSAVFQFGPSITQDCLPGRVEPVLDNIIAHLQQGGRLSRFKLWLNSEWKELINHAKVAHQRPSSLEHFEALRLVARWEVSQSAIISRWQRQVSSLGGPLPDDLGKHPEQACHQFLDIIRQCLDWYPKVWKPFEQELINRGFAWPDFLSTEPPQLLTLGELRRMRGAVNKLPAILEAQKNRLCWQNVSARLQEYATPVEQAATVFADSGVVKRLHFAFNELSPNKYREAYERLVDLQTRSQALRLRRELLGRLEKVAPVWASAIRNRLGHHGHSTPPGDTAEAWKWRQLHDELKRRAETSLETLQNEIARSGNKLRKVTAWLVEKKAWAAQLRRTSLPQQQALAGWKSIMKKVGKGTGIKAPRLLAEARKLTPICQTAIPVWIMPLSKVVEDFDPKRNRFDVVIIDEASQADVMALTALYFGDKVVVVGDDEQVSPMNVGQDTSSVQNLIAQHLNDIPNATLYDGQTSIYDLAMASFAGVICLREHFRCVPPIIQFSNRLSYDWKIKPLRDESQVRLKPHTIAYRVDNAIADGNNVNELEALTITSLVAACVEQPEYDGATIGVISMVGQAQANRINQLLQNENYLKATEYSKRQILCGIPSTFQGDERDVIFLSMVNVSENNAPLPLRATGIANDPYKKRFNVAASRARDQMWVIHSLDPDRHLKDKDLRRQLILHAQNPYAVAQQFESQAQETESEFERKVLRHLMQAGYRVVPQWKVGAYRIDLVVEGGGKRLAVECDGDRWHGPENLADDMARQAILERLGWRFARIRGSLYFRSPDTAMKPVFAKLEELGIPPEGHQDSPTDIAGEGEELKGRVIRRAAELRREWTNSKQEIPLFVNLA